MKDDSQIIYIAGYARSGSTVVGDVLARQLNGIHIGETYWLPDRGWGENWACSCGEAFRKCPLWGRVAGAVHMTDDKAHSLIVTRSVCRTRNVLTRKWKGASEEYVAFLRCLYRAIHDLSGCKVIIDSSKFPGYGYVLATQAFPGRVHVVHLVRALPGVAFSQKYRPKPVPTGHGERWMEAAGVTGTALLWTLWQLDATRLRSVAASYRLARLETLAHALPVLTTGLAQEMGLGEVTPSGTLEPSHVFSGNPGRFDTKKPVLRLTEARPPLPKLEAFLTKTVQKLVDRFVLQRDQAYFRSAGAASVWRSSPSTSGKHHS